MRKLWRMVMFALPVAALLSGCYKEDINELKRRADEHDAQLKTMSEWRETINKEIETLHDLIEALQANDMVTDVTETATGYVIAFTSGRTITIKHGEKGATGEPGAPGTPGTPGTPGEPGVSPVITVEYHPDDNAYCWKCNGEWLLDNQNRRINAVGSNGLIPVIGIRQGNPGNDELSTDYYWTVTLGNTTEDILGPDDKPLKANGEKGDSFFLNVDNDDDSYLVVTLNDQDNTVIKLKKYRAIGLSWDDYGSFHLGEEKVIPFSYTGREQDDLYTYPVYVLSYTRDWEVGIVSDHGGSFYVKAPAEKNEFVNGRALFALLDHNGDIIRTYQLELNTMSPTDYEVGDIYYEYNIPVGVVFRKNDGTEGSGLVVEARQLGPITSTFRKSAWEQASDWAADFGHEWRLPTLEELRTLYNVWTVAGGADDANTFNALLTGLSGDVLGMQPSGSKIYWTSEEMGAMRVNAKIFRFASGIGTGDPGDDASGGHSKVQNGYYARAVRTF